MELFKADGQNFIFRVGKREKRLLEEVLQLYPMLSGSYGEISSGPDDGKLGDAQKLLEQALAEQHRANRQELESLLREPTWLKEKAGMHQLTLSLSRMEWLLQILNNIRVGCWVALGAPQDTALHLKDLNEKTIRYFVSMEGTAYFQSVLLKALQRAAL